MTYVPICHAFLTSIFHLLPIIVDIIAAHHSGKSTTTLKRMPNTKTGYNKFMADIKSICFIVGLAMCLGL